jgi:hypothetical protein
VIFPAITPLPDLLGGFVTKGTAKVCEQPQQR